MLRTLHTIHSTFKSYVLYIVCRMLACNYLFFDLLIYFHLLRNTAYIFWALFTAERYCYFDVVYLNGPTCKICAQSVHILLRITLHDSVLY